MEWHHFFTIITFVFVVEFDIICWVLLSQHIEMNGGSLIDKIARRTEKM